MNTTDLKSFNYLENGDVMYSELDTIKSCKKLHPDVYDIFFIPYPVSKVGIKVNGDTETVKTYPNPEEQKIDKLFNAFFTPIIKEKVNKLGFYHKVGILLHGKEGTGKSTILKSKYKKFIEEQDCIVFNILEKGSNLSDCWKLIQDIRKIQDNPIIALFEEFDTFCENGEADLGLLKTAFDGNRSIDNCIYLATTNHLENIPDTIKNRPSRFKYVLEIKGISETKDILSILQDMIGDIYSEKQLTEFSKELKDNSIDEIKQFCLDKLMELDTHNNTKSKLGFALS